MVSRNLRVVYSDTAGECRFVLRPECSDELLRSTDHPGKILTYGRMESLFILHFQVYSLLSLEPCSYVRPVWECVALRFSGVLGFIFTHFAILIERTAACFLPQYEKRGPALSLTLVPLLVT